MKYLTTLDLTGTGITLQVQCGLVYNKFLKINSPASPPSPSLQEWVYFHSFCLKPCELILFGDAVVPSHNESTVSSQLNFGWGKLISGFDDYRGQVDTGNKLPALDPVCEKTAVSFFLSSNSNPASLA